MLDMIIKGGRVVTPAGVGNWDLGIVGETSVGYRARYLLRDRVSIYGAARRRRGT